MILPPMLTAAVVSAALLLAGPVPAPAPHPEGTALVPEPGAAQPPSPEPPQPEPDPEPAPEPAPAQPATDVPASAAEPSAIFIPTADDDPAADDPDFTLWTPSPETLRRNRETTTARTMVAAGGLSGIAAVLMLIAAGVEAGKPPCKFALDDCSAAPRKGLAVGLGLTGAVLAVGGGALLGVGVHRLRRLRASIAADERTGMLRLGGRF